jgi:hypothetical protein
MDISIIHGADGNVSVSVHNESNQVCFLLVPSTTNPDITLETAFGRCVFGPEKTTALSPVVDVTNAHAVEVGISLEESATPATTMRTPYGEVVVGPSGSALPPPPPL